MEDQPKRSRANTLIQDKVKSLPGNFEKIIIELEFSLEKITQKILASLSGREIISQLLQHYSVLIFYF